MKQTTEHRDTAMRLALIEATIKRVEGPERPLSSTVLDVARAAYRHAGRIPVKSHWSVTRRKGR